LLKNKQFVCSKISDPNYNMPLR